MANGYSTIIGQDTDECINWIMKGVPVAIPTETVYGLAANALDEDAILKIYSIKNRPSFNPLIIHISSLEKIRRYVSHLPEQAIKLAETYWPGPLTLLLPKSELVPDLVTAGSNLVAIRVPAHPLTLRVLQSVDFPLAAPSANPSGYVSPTTSEHVYQNLKNKIPYILEVGPCDIGLESTIIGFNGEGNAVLYRYGGLETDKIEKVTGTKLMLHKADNNQPATSGQLLSHYATDSPLFLDADLSNIPSEKSLIYLIRFKSYHPDFPLSQQRLLSPSGSMDEAARNLFTILRELDAINPPFIYVEKVPEEGLGIAINDRLTRAQHIYKKQ